MDLETSFFYFSNWDVSTIHILTSIPLYQTIADISDRLKIKPERVKKILTFLRSKDLVALENDRWIFKGDPIFLPGDSILNNFHQINRREQVIKSIREQDSRNIHFTSLFAIDEATFISLKKEIQLLIENAHLKIQSAPSNEIYSITVDCFRVV